MSEQNMYEVSMQKLTKTNVFPAFKMKVFAPTISDADSLIADIAEHDGYRVAGKPVLVGTFDPDERLVTHLDPSLDLEVSILNSIEGMIILEPETGLKEI